MSDVDTMIEPGPPPKRKAAPRTRAATRRAEETAKDTVDKATETVTDAASSAKAVTSKAVTKVRKSTKKAVASTRATRAAKAGMVEDARQIAAAAGAREAVAEAISEVEEMQYQAEVNKRGLSVTALTKTLNARWANGWRLAHILEQRGNTVMIFEKRQS